MAPNAPKVTAQAATACALASKIRFVLGGAAQRLLRGVHLALAAPQARVETAAREQLLMPAAFGDDPLVEHQDFIGMHDGRQPVRDDQRRAPPGDPLERGLNLALGEAVERRGRLVEHQNRRRLQNGARDGDALLLAAREFQAALADLRAVTLRQRANEGVDLRVLRRRLDLRVARRVAAVADVVEDRIVEQHGVLRNHADRRAQRSLRNGADILPIDGYPTRRWLIEPKQQARNRRLSRSGRADDGDRVARRRLERYSPQDRPVRVVMERNVLETDRAPETSRSRAPGASRISGCWSRMSNIAPISTIACLISRYTMPMKLSG